MKRFISIIIVLLLAVIAAGAYHFSTIPKEKMEVHAEEPVLGENQEYLTGTIQSVTGNEISLEDGSSFLISVGTKVETRLGTETTFSRLRSKDQVKLLLEEAGEGKEIVKVWITQ